MVLRALAGDLKALKTLAGLSGRSKKRRAVTWAGQDAESETEYANTSLLVVASPAATA
jgi:hypothetical protein